MLNNYLNTLLSEGKQLTMTERQFSFNQLLTMHGRIGPDLLDEINRIFTSLDLYGADLRVLIEARDIVLRSANCLILLNISF